MRQSSFFTRDYSINLDISNKCTLVCPKCIRARYNSAGLEIPGEELSLDSYYKIINHFKYLIFCGQTSDPTMHTQFHKLLEIAYERGVYLEVHVAASHRPIEWFEKAFDINPNTKWCFGIDGLPNSSHQYRKRQDGKKIFDMMCRAREKGLYCVWQYIIFAYNENEIEKARNLAAEKNIEFHLVKSSRFLKKDTYKPSSNNYISR